MGESLTIGPFPVSDEAKSIQLSVEGTGEFRAVLRVKSGNGRLLWSGGVGSVDKGHCRIGAGKASYKIVNGKLKTTVKRYKNQHGSITVTALTNLACELSAQNSITIGTPASVDGFGTGLTVSVDAGSGSDRVMVAAFLRNTAQTINAFTYNGNALTAILGAAGDNSNRHAALYRYIAPATGAHDLVSTLAGAGTHGIAGIPLDGVDQTTPAENGTGAGGTASPITVDVTSATGNLVIDAFWVQHSGGGSTTTVGASQTAQIDRENFSGADSWGVSTEAGATTVTMSWTSTNVSGWAQAACSIKASAAADIAQPKIMLMGIGV